MNLYQEFRIFEKGMISFVLTEKIKSRIFKNYKYGIFFTSIFLFIFFIILLKGITILAYSDLLTDFQGWLAVICTAFITTYSIVFVHISYTFSIKQLRQLQNATIIFKKDLLIKWIKTLKRPIVQVLFSLLSVLIFAFALHWFSLEEIITFQLNSKTSFLVLFAILWLTQGAYWSILLPLLTLLFKQVDFKKNKNLVNEKFELFERNQILNALSKICKFMSAVMALTVILCLIGLLLMPRNSFHLSGIIALVVVGYLFTFWTLIFSHLNIAKAEKIANSFEVNFWRKYIIEKNYSLKKQNIDNDELMALNSAINIYDFIKSNQVKFFDYSLISRIFWSFVIPTIIAIIGTLMANSFK